MEITLAILSVFVGITGIGYAFRVNHEMSKRENLVRFELRGVAGNIVKIQQSARWGFWHFAKIQELVLELPESERRSDILKKLQLGHGDITAAGRILSNLLNQVLITQEGLFKTREIDHPEVEELLKTK